MIPTHRTSAAIISSSLLFIFNHHYQLSSLLIIIFIIKGMPNSMTWAILSIWVDQGEVAVLFCKFMQPFCISVWFWLTHCGLVTSYGDIALANIGSCNGLLPCSTKRLPKPMLIQCSKLNQKSCQSCCLESQIINIKLKKSFKKVTGPPPKLSASGWRTGSNLEHWLVTHQRDIVTFTWGWFCRKCSRYLSLIWYWNLLIQDNRQLPGANYHG